MALSPFLHPFAKPAAEQFITIVRGEGAAVFDDTGKRYVDGLASLWYCNVGHGRAEIADAVDAQLRVLENYNTFDIFTNGPAEEIAAVISALSPVPDGRVFLTCSGSEAVDTALKLARMTFTRRGEPERQVLVGRTLAYHGVNYGGVSVQGLPLNQEGWGPLLGPVAQIAHDDLTTAERLFAERGHEIAAVIAEPVVGAGGVYPASVEYLRGLRKLCDETGALLIFDEVITGFGRLGSWFASEYYGVVPDMITFAKAVTSGYQPLGGVIVGPRVRDALEADPDFILRHGYTYSGHPASCVAAPGQHRHPARREAARAGAPHRRAARRGTRPAGRRGSGGRGSGRGGHLGAADAPGRERAGRAPGPARPRRHRPAHRSRGAGLLPSADHRRRRRGPVRGGHRRGPPGAAPLAR